MEIRGEEVLLPVSAVSAFPRPHWLQGRVFGSQYEPTYRSHNLRVAYDLVKLRGRSYADASAELGAPVDALKQRVHRASEEIRASVSLFLEAS